MRTLKFLALMGVAPALSACLNLNKSYPEKRSFVLDVNAEQHETVPDPTMVLKINKFRVSPLFAGRAMVYRVAELQYENDFYDEWFVSPGSLVSQQFQDWLSKSGRFRFVLLGTNHIEPTHLLDGSVVDFYGDYRVADAPKAVFKVELHVLDGVNERQVVFQRTYQKEMRLTEQSPEAFASGLSQAVRLVLVDFERELAEIDTKPLPSSHK